MINQPPAARPVPWFALFAVDFAVSCVTLVLFGLFGGLTLLIALNGFSGDEGLRIMIVYALLVVAGNALATSLFNWLILRGRAQRGGRVPRRAVFAPAVATTLVLLVAGPPLAVIMIKLLFGS
jgi:hypothetical protein